MGYNDRELVVHGERCIGCRACATVCPEALITRTDAGLRRALSFSAVCSQDCRLCVEACPVDALALRPGEADKARSAIHLGFDLMACTECGEPRGTQEMLAWLRTTIPAPVQADAEGRGWMDLCPACRQRAEAASVAAEGLLTRWP